MINPPDLLQTQLTILQLEEYSLIRWWKWWWKHPLTMIQKPRKKLVYTWRVRGILILGALVSLLGLIGLTSIKWWLGLAGLLVIGLWPGLPVCLGLILMAPVGWLFERYQIRMIRQALRRYPHLKVIGITGSYGKTTVKEMLYEILDRSGYALVTPESFNTIGGIYRVIRQELNRRQETFICEMGAYRPGDVKRLAKMVGVDYGIITGVGPQHLERFGSLKKIMETKFELVQTLLPKKVIVNWDSQPIQEYVKNMQLQDKILKLSFYDPTADFYVLNYQWDKDKLNLTLVYQTKQIQISMDVFGTAMAYDAALAAGLALLMNVSNEVVVKGLEAYRPAQHRLTLSKMGKAIMIDNTFSSNADSFKLVMQDLKNLPGKKVLVTPGLVETGKREQDIHQQLGLKASGVFDEVILVGKSNRTKWLKMGYQGERPAGIVQLIEPEPTKYWQTIKKLGETYDWILLENDLPDQYF